MDVRFAESHQRGFSRQTTEALRAGMTLAAHGDDSGLDDALRGMCAEARREGRPPEHVVIALKRMWHGMSRPTVPGSTAWDALYRHALTRALALYFEPSP